MAQHYVKCVYCEEQFNRDKEPTTQVSARRYAHKKCADKYLKEKTKEEQDLEKLEKYIMKLFDESYVNARIRKQLRDFRKEYNYSYSGILKTLIYWYEVKGNSIEQSNGGIGIVPFVFEQAKQYYYSLYLIKLSNQDKNIKEYKPKIRQIKIQPPKRAAKKKKLFDLGDEE